MYWPAIFSLALTFAIVFAGCWWLDRQGTTAPRQFSDASSDDGAVALALTLGAAMSANSPEATDSTNSATSSPLSD